MYLKGGNDMNERIKMLRKQLHLTAEQFGMRIGISKSSVSNIENGNRNVTNQTVKLICREFNVDYTWLTTGQGEMFINKNDDVMAEIDNIMFGENEFHKNLFKTFAELSTEELSALESIIDRYISISQNNAKNQKESG